MSDGSIGPRIVASAFVLFEERGYDHTTVDDIVERAGVGRTTFFRQFGSKEDVIFPDHAQILAAVEARLLTASDDTAWLAVSDAALLVLRHYVDEGALARSRYGLTSTVAALRDREVASIQRYQRLFTRYLRRWGGGTDGASLNAEVAAAAVIATHNHVLRAWLRGDTEDPEADFSRAMEHLRTMMSVGPRTEPSGVTTAVVAFETSRPLGDVVHDVQRVLGLPPAEG